MSSNKTLPQGPKISELKKNKKNIKSLLYLPIGRGITAGFSAFNVRQNNLEELIKTSLLSSIPEFLIQDFWCGVQELAFLTISQVMLLVKNHNTFGTIITEEQNNSIQILEVLITS